MGPSSISPLTRQVYSSWRPHVVDQLIAERAGGLRANRAAWAMTRALVLPLLGYKAAVKMADRLAPMSGRMAINWMSAQLGLRTTVHAPADLPAHGPALVVANHPGGIADGVAVWDALVAARPDLIFFANRDALRVAPRLAEVIVPVEWRAEARTRDKTRATLRAAGEAFRDGRVVVMFPAGRMAQFSWRDFALAEPDWTTSAVSLARKHHAPIIPLGVQARMSTLYYVLAQVSEPLKNMTLFHELLRARHARYGLRFGARIDPHADLPMDLGRATRFLRKRCEALAWRGRA